MFGIPGWVIQCGIAIGIVLGIYFYGHHEGSLAGIKEVSDIKMQIATQNEAFGRQVRAIEARNEVEKQREKDAYTKEIQTQTVANTKLQSTINGLLKSNSFVTQIERFTKTSTTACLSALALTNRQYNELADLAGQASTRADNSAATANALNDYAQRIN